MRSAKTPERLFGSWTGTSDAEIVRAAADLLRNGEAESTRAKRKLAVTLFDEFCIEECVPNVPADAATIIAFLNALPASRGHANLETYVNAIRDRQLSAGLEDPLTPTVARALVGFHRRSCGRPQQRYALEVDQVAALVDMIRTLPMPRDDQILHLCRLRDIALILLTFSQNVQFCYSRLFLRAQLLDEPKTIVVRCRDEIGRDLFVGPGRDPRTCPVAALRTYLRARTDSSPYLFAAHKNDRGLPLTPQVFTNRLQSYVRAAGLSRRLFSPTSLRRGAARAAAAANADAGQALSHLGIRSLKVLNNLAKSKRSPVFPRPDP